MKNKLHTLIALRDLLMPVEIWAKDLARLEEAKV